MLDYAIISGLLALLPKEAIFALGVFVGLLGRNARSLASAALSKARSRR